MRPLLFISVATLFAAAGSVSAHALVAHLPGSAPDLLIQAQSTGGGDNGGSDGGSADGGSTDGGSTDGGSTDGGSTDGGSTDGGSTDGGSTDGGSTDGGSDGGSDNDGGRESSGYERTDPGPAVYESYRNATVYGLQLQSAVEACIGVPRPVQQINGCIADALDAFATRLDSNSVSLPESGAEIPQIVRRAASAVRSAPTVAAARRAVQTAVSDVAKTIELIRATDSDPGRTLARQSGAIVEALVAVDSGLARATGI